MLGWIIYCYSKKNIFKSYDYYLDAVNRDGVPYELTMKMIPMIEGEVNNILSQIVDFSILFINFLLFIEGTLDFWRGSGSLPKKLLIIYNYMFLQYTANFLSI